MGLVSDDFPWEPLCKWSSSRLFHKVCQRNQFLLTSRTINHHFWASKLELYVITNVRARFQSSQTPVFSHFKRCLGTRDLESHFTSEFVQLWEFSLGSSFHTAWIEHMCEETAKNLGDIIKNILRLLFINLLSFLVQIIFLESFLRVLENIKTQWIRCSDSGSMPTSDQGMSCCMPGSIFGEILLSVFSGSMDNNWQFGIVIIGSSVLLLMNPCIYKSPYSKVRPKLNLDCVWTHKVTALANNCRSTFMAALPLS